MKTTLAYAIRSYTGFLEGTGKSRATVESYARDLATFREFLEEGWGSEPVPLDQLTAVDLTRYAEYLQARHLKTNTRRRKLLTVRRLFRYLKRRNRLTTEVAHRLPAPYKVERVPAVVEWPALVAAIRALPTTTPLDARNRVLLWTLAETGCAVSEITRLRPEDWIVPAAPEAVPGTACGLGAGRALLEFQGKAPRQVPISAELRAAALALSPAEGGGGWMFPGYNRHGALGGPISARGVELVVRAYAARLGFVDLVPRMIRHSAVAHWLRAGEVPEDIRRRLGLKTLYAFRVYLPLLQANGLSP